MAERRMIHTKISLSEQVDSVSNWAQLLYSWSIPHADDAGVLPRKAKVLKAKVFPLKELTGDQMEALIKELITEKLLMDVTIDDKEYLYVVNFWKHQTLQEDRNPKLLFDYPLEEVKGKTYKEKKPYFERNWAKIKDLVSTWNPNGIQMVHEGKGREGKLSEDKGREDTPPTSSKPKKTTKKRTTKTSMRTLEELREQFPDKKLNWLYEKAWMEWWDYRMETKKPMPKTTVVRQLKTLFDNKKDHVKMIELSIERGWQGLFALKDKGLTDYAGGQMSDQYRKMLKQKQYDDEVKARQEAAKNNDVLREIEEKKKKLLGKMS